MDRLEGVVRWVAGLPTSGDHDENLAALVPGFRQGEAWATVSALLPTLADSVRLEPSRIMTVSLVLHDVGNACAPLPRDEPSLAASVSDLFPPTVVVGSALVPWSRLWEFERHMIPLPSGVFGSDVRYVVTLDRSRQVADEPFAQRLRFQLAAHRE